MDLASRVADLAVSAQTARTNGSHATAEQLDQQTKETIQDAHLRGEIADHVAFHREVSKKIIQRHAAKLHDILGLGTLLKGKL